VDGSWMDADDSPALTRLRLDEEFPSAERLPVSVDGEVACLEPIQWLGMRRKRIRSWTFDVRRWVFDGDLVKVRNVWYG